MIPQVSPVLKVTGDQLVKAFFPGHRRVPQPSAAGRSPLAIQRPPARRQEGSGRRSPSCCNDLCYNGLQVRGWAWKDHGSPHPRVGCSGLSRRSLVGRAAQATTGRCLCRAQRYSLAACGPFLDGPPVRQRPCAPLADSRLLQQRRCGVSAGSWAQPTATSGCRGAGLVHRSGTDGGGA